MKHRFVWAILFAALALSGRVGYAHHSFAATYDDKKSVQIEGTIVQLLFRNPHSFLAVEDKSGVRWSIEWGGATVLFSRGVSRDSLKTGDQVVITATPGRDVDEDHRVLMKTLRRPSDGFGWGTLPGQVVE